MNRLIKKSAKIFLAFMSTQYLVLLLAATTSVKLALAYDLSFRLNWYHEAFSHAIWVDISLALVVFAIILMFKRFKNVLAILVATVLSLALIVDSVYFSYFSAFPSAGMLGTLGQTSDIGPAIIGLIKWQLVFYILDLILLAVFYRKIKKTAERLSHKFQTKTDFTPLLSLLVVFATLALFWVHFPNDSKMGQVIERGYDTKSTAQQYGILTAHGVDVFRYINEQTTKLSVEEQNALIKWVGDNKPDQAFSALTKTAKGKNIIMIQVESLGGFVVNQTYNSQEITPNLNKLAKDSYFFPNDRFFYGGGHTSDTDFATNTSFFPLDNSAIFVRYGGNDFSSLPKTLKKSGYSAYAYHGYNRYFWNRNQALASLGYDKFYAAENYPKGTILNMGLNDGDFLDKTADYIKKQPKPSLSYVITLSSHVPFATSPLTKQLGVDESKYPSQVGGYLENINFTDRMLGKFFDKLKSAQLYDDSLIVLYGDHTPVLPEFSAGTITYDPLSDQGKEVPLFIKLPNQTTGETREKSGTHLDITPTIIDLVGIKTNQLMFGQSLFANGDKALKVCYDQLVSFSNDNCRQMIETEKVMSSKIVRYNQFGQLPK